MRRMHLEGMKARLQEKQARPGEMLTAFSSHYIELYWQVIGSH
jgi:hypothetical protein